MCSGTTLPFASCSATEQRCWFCSQPLLERLLFWSRVHRFEPLRLLLGLIAESNSPLKNSDLRKSVFLNGLFVATLCSRRGGRYTRIASVLVPRFRSRGSIFATEQFFNRLLSQHSANRNKREREREKRGDESPPHHLCGRSVVAVACGRGPFAGLQPERHPRRHGYRELFRGSGVRGL
jgi:hypothetical protein